MVLIVQIKVVPSSGTYKWALDKANQLKCYLKSPPEKNLANNELIKNLANELGMIKADIEIIAGMKSRNKTVKINKCIDIADLLGLLQLTIPEKQKTIF